MFRVNNQGLLSDFVNLAPSFKTKIVLYLCIESNRLFKLFSQFMGFYNSEMMKKAKIEKIKAQIKSYPVTAPRG